MSKGVKQQDLLYVSNGNGVVNVYRYWQHTLVAVLGNFTNPRGECTDAAGDVYIVDEKAEKIDYSLYRVIVTHGQAYYVGMTSFTSSGIRGPFWFYNNKSGSQATELVGGLTSSNGSDVYYWSYPAGGSPLYTLTHGIYKPVGVTVSPRTI